MNSHRRFALMNVLVSLFWLVSCTSTHTDTCPNVSTNLVDDHLGATDFERLESTPRDNSERATEALRYLSRDCRDPQQFAIAHTGFSSYGCVIPGSMPGRILIGAHYDKVAAGRGVADNWTGIVLIAHLAGYFAQHPPHHTLQFVAFGEEEPGLLGSKAFLKSHPASNFDAMINLDTLGLGPVTIQQPSSKILSCLTHSIGNNLNIKIRTNTLPETEGDGSPFEQLHVPVLSLYSLDRSSIRIIHTWLDRYIAVDHHEIDDAYRVTLNVLIALDSQSEFFKP